MNEEEDLLSFGIDAATGHPLPVPGDDVFETLLDNGRKRALPIPLTLALKTRDEAALEARSFGMAQDEEEIDSNDLSHAGWGILYGPSVSQDVKDALKPLIELRMAQGAEPLEILDYIVGEDIYQWLQRHKVSLNPVVPKAGVPYFLLIVAPAEEINFDFQYVLDIYWAVGRLWFNTAAEFGQYAKSVAEYEEPARKPVTSRQIVLFAPEHDFDKATQLFTSQVAKPLCGGGSVDPLGHRSKFALQAFMGAQATKKNLGEILRGGIDGGSPALLFSGGHGMQFKNGDPKQLATQGALVCQDWPAYGPISEEHWFSAQDVPADAKIHGLMYFMFACHGGGVPQFDNFDRTNDAPAEIASRPFFSKLPQALLTHPKGGALAVLAHIERAWAYGFQGDGGIAQIQGIKGVLALLLRGDRIGVATDMFNQNWATNGVRLTEAMAARERNPAESITPIKRYWIRRDDARNFMIFGDPAVRLRVKDLV